MSDHPVISVENLSKRYVIGHETRHDTLRDRLSHGVGRLFRGRKSAGEEEEFWALRDVSFDIRQGEVVGVIGRNGAGKSTLLKILSRITEPTAGRVSLRGRVASLLEVGTGFHPELTGRENIYLNGAILGMSRMEIRKKFDEIVAFAEVERFLDTPVKRYSSGMYVRLAFAVAAHLEPEILIVDEVLAVGDVAFQQKCIGKMQDVARGEGRTVIFVSHNMVATQSLCDRALLLNAGMIEFDGGPVEAVARYLRRDPGIAGAAEGTFHGRDPALRVDRLTFDRAHATINLAVTIRTSVRRTLALECILLTTTGVPVAFANQGTLDYTCRLDFPPGEKSLRAGIEASSLANGTYVLRLQLVDSLAHIMLRHEHEGQVEVSRVPVSCNHRVLELDWQSGAVELPLRLES
jgi:ABC-type polysaccharide/polyol phosphate transport system ATPase subunit